MASSLLTRKRDLLYFIFFVIHVPIIFRTTPETNITAQSDSSI